MENGIMNKFLELFGSSSKWGQLSNSNFTDYIIDENRHLKTELQSLRREAEKRQGELRDELVKLRQKNKELEEKLRLRTRPPLPAGLDGKRRSVSAYTYPTFEQSETSTAATNMSYQHTSKRRCANNINVPVYIPTPIGEIKCATSTVTSDANSIVNDNSRVYDDRAVNDVVPVSVSTASENSSNVNGIDDISLSVNSSVPVNANTAPYGSSNVNNSLSVNVTAVNVTPPVNVTPSVNITPRVNVTTSPNVSSISSVNGIVSVNGSLTTNVIPPVNGITSNNIKPDIINSTEGYMGNYTSMNIDAATRARFPFVATPLNSVASVLPIRKKSSTKVSRHQRIQTPAQKRKIPTISGATSIYTPSIYDGMVVNVSSDDDNGI